MVLPNEVPMIAPELPVLAPCSVKFEIPNWLISTLKSRVIFSTVPLSFLSTPTITASTLSRSLIKSPIDVQFVMVIPLRLTILSPTLICSI